MKRNIYIILVLVLSTQCSQSQKQDVKCNNLITIEKTEICMPKLKGLSDISTSPEYNNYIKQFEFQGNEILAFYIKNSLISNISEPQYDYISIFINSQLRNNIAKSVFKEMSETMGEHFRKDKEILKLINEIETNYFNNISLDIPVLIDSYSLTDNIKTYILLGKIFTNGDEIVTLTTLNLMYIRKKMIMSNYIIKYNNSQSINEIKQKNDYFVMRLLDINK